MPLSIAYKDEQVVNGRQTLTRTAGFGLLSSPAPGLATFARAPCRPVPFATDVPMSAGSFVTRFGKQVHYDIVKDVETVLETAGGGPATATPAAQK